MFFKKEVYAGNSLEESKSLTQNLSQHGIKYYTKTDYHNHNASIGRSAAVGRYFEKSVQPTYYIYVRKKDYDTAREIVFQYHNTKASEE